MLSRLARAPVASLKPCVRFNSHLTSERNPGNYILNPTSDLSQFSKALLVNHGELEDGVIPEALKYTRPTSLSTLPNGLRVATETIDSPLAHLAVYFRAGVRNENMKNNGVGEFLKNLRLKGTDKRTATQLAAELESIGATVSMSAGREISGLHIQVLAENVPKAVELLADLALSTQFKAEAIEHQRVESLHALRDTSCSEKLILDNIHYTAFRDHMLGQPVKGNHKTLASLSAEDLHKYVTTLYTGSRAVLVGTGKVEHTQLADLVEKHFGQLPKEAGEVTGEEKPVFTGSLIQIRDDDVDMAHMGVFYKAPSWNDEDFYSFMLLERLIGDYFPERDSIINHPHLQYNFLHKFVGEMEDFGYLKTFYFPYKDAGLIGCYANSMDLGSFLVPPHILKAFKRVTGLVMESEMYRARNKLYNDLLSNETISGVNKEVANQLVYAQRRVPRSEIAKRISVMDPRFLEKTYAKWLWDVELALSFYGPTFTLGRMYGIYRAYTNDTQQV